MVGLRLEGRLVYVQLLLYVTVSYMDDDVDADDDDDVDVVDDDDDVSVVS